MNPQKPTSNQKPTKARAHEQAQFTQPANASERAQIETDLQRLDCEIAAHASGLLSGLGLGCMVQPYQVMLWRHSNDPMYLHWRGEYLSVFYWAMQEAETDRAYPVIGTLALIMVGVLAALIAQGVGHMFAAWGGH